MDLMHASVPAQIQLTKVDVVEGSSCQWQNRTNQFQTRHLHWKPLKNIVTYRNQAYCIIHNPHAKTGKD